MSRSDTRALIRPNFVSQNFFTNMTKYISALIVFRASKTPILNFDLYLHVCVVWHSIMILKLISFNLVGRHVQIKEKQKFYI